MKFTTISAGILLFFSLIISKTDATCEDCLNIQETILYCDSANGSACVANSVQISDAPPSPPLLIDCCDSVQYLFDQCIKGCQDQYVVSTTMSYCPYNPPC